MKSTPVNQEYLNQTIQEIAGQLQEALPRQWLHLALCYLPATPQMQKEVYKIYYLLKDGDAYVDLIAEISGMRPVIKGPYYAKRVCAELYEKSLQSGQPFTMFSLSIHREGKFDADFSYTPFKDFTPADQMAWKKSVFI